MTKPMRIDFVSDISCPWCVIGLKGLEEALRQVGDLVEAEIHLQPSELNPDMPAEGQNVREHVEQKYGPARGDSSAIRETIRARAADVGFTIATSEDSRIYNTFDAHRLLHWAGLEGRQAALKHALFQAYFTDGEDPSAHDVLVRLAVKVGLDAARAQAILASDTYAKEVREREDFYREHGIDSVPAIIINDRHLIQGGQPTEVFEKALRQIAAEQGGNR